MSQPPPYNRQASFANLQALNPSGQPPGNTMDAEYNAVKTTLDATLANLALIQNDDTTLGNETVGPAQLSSQLVLGFTAPSAWVTAHAYTASPASTVLQGTAMYICLVSHTSGVFATDLAAGKWLKIFDLSTLTFGNASQIAVSNHGTNVTSNVQTSLNNLEDNKAAVSHTHTASQISDSSAAGRALLTAASVAVQQTLLGLGSLAFLNSITIANIPGQLTFTASVTPASLGTDVSDYTPTGWATLSTLLQASLSAVSITGFGATTDGDLKFVENIGTFTITLRGNSSASALANRILIPAPLALRPGQSVTLRYNNNGGYVGWSVLSSATANPAVGTFRNLRVGNAANFLGDAAPSSPTTQLYLYADDIILKDANGAAWATSISAAPIDSAVVGANGIDSGSLGASTWYSIWAIGNAASSTTAGLISTSATAPTLPSGYTFKARVGWMRTDGSSHFLKTIQYGRVARYVAASALPSMTTGNQTAQAVAVANFVPTTATKIAVVLRSSSATSGAISVASNATISAAQVGNAINANGGMDVVGEFLLEGSTVVYTSTGGASTKLDAYGWEDNI